MQLRQGCRLWWLVIPILLIDQLTKHFARQLTGVVSAVDGLVSWAHTRNHGAAFSMFSGKTWLLTGVTAALIIVLIIYQMRHAGNASAERIGIWCIIGGGLGNLIDRIISGSVTDFIRLDFVRFAIFNAADIFVCAGAFLVVLSTFTTDFWRKKHG